MPVIEARAVISATDKTGGVFKKIAGQFKEISSSAKALGSIKPIAGWGTKFQKEIDALKLSAREIDTVRKSWENFNRALQSGRPLKADAHFGAIRMWKERTVADLRAVRAAFDQTERRQNSFVRRGARFAIGAAGFGSAAYLAQRTARASALAGSESIREKARDYLAGMSDDETKRLQSRAGELSLKYPSITQTSLHERLRDTAMSMRSIDKAFAVSDAIARGTVVLQSLKGNDQAIEEGRKFFRGLDVLGKNQDPKQVASLFNGYIKALGVEGADLDLGDVFAVAKQSRSAGLALSDRFLMSVVPGLIGDMGAPQVGTALSSGLSQTIGGRATKQSKAAQREYGLRDKRGNFLDANLYQSDLDQYVYNRLLPALQRKGINSDDAGGVNSAISTLFSNKVVADILSKLVLQREQYQAKGRQYDRAPGLSAAGELRGRDPFVAAEGFVSQLKNLAAALSEPAFPAATAVLNSLSGTFGAFANRFAGADGLGKAEMGLGAGLVGGYAAHKSIKIGRAAYQWFNGAGALTGAAAALDGSAAALTAAAAKLAGGSIAGELLDKAPGGKKGWLSRAWSGAAKAVPFLGRYALPVAALGGGAWALTEATPAIAKADPSILPPVDPARSSIDAMRRITGSGIAGAMPRPLFGMDQMGQGQPVKAEVEGNATLDAKIKVEPSPYFWTSVDQRIDNRINAFKSSGVTSQGTAGSTGRASPDAAAAP